MVAVIQPEPNSVAASIVAGQIDNDTILRARALIVSQRGHELFDCILRRNGKQSTDKEDTLERTMKTLEAIMNVDVMVGGYLMAKLSDPVGKTTLHHVGDAIDLWFEHYFEKEIVEAAHPRSFGLSWLADLIEARLRTDESIQGGG